MIVSPPPSTLLTDNQSTEALVQQRGAMGARSKHIDVRHHHIREVVLSGAARVQWVPTAEQLADAFTKALPSATFHRLRGKIMGEAADEVVDRGQSQSSNSAGLGLAGLAGDGPALTRQSVYTRGS